MIRRCALLLITAASFALEAAAQVPPSAEEVAAYRGLHAAAQQGDVAHARAASQRDVDARDNHGRTPLHVATFARQRSAIQALVAAGADTAALEDGRYDAVTIAAVADDEETLRVLLASGASARLVTSRYDGTALIEAIVLGSGGPRHAAVVRDLLAAGASHRLTDREGRTPLALARSRGYAVMVEALERVGAK